MRYENCSDKISDIIRDQKENIGYYMPYFEKRLPPTSLAVALNSKKVSHTYQSTNHLTIHPN